MTPGRDFCQSLVHTTPNDVNLAICLNLYFYRLPKTSRNDEFNFNEWMAEKDKLARSTLEKFDKRFGLPEDFKLTPPLFDDAEKWTPIS